MKHNNFNEMKNKQNADGEGEQQVETKSTFNLSLLIGRLAQSVV